jgi:hypothetical protein
VIYGLGHPRRGTGFTADLLKQSGLDVGHEYLRKDGIVSWEIASLRSDLPWGNGVTDFEAGAKIFLVARSPLGALNSVVTECMQIRSIGFRASVIYEHFDVEIFSQANQRIAEPHFDYMTWSVLSLIYWYELCFSHNPEIIFRVDHSEDDKILTEYLGHEVSRENKSIRVNKKPYSTGDYPIGRIEDQDSSRLELLADMCIRLGYEEDAKKLKSFLFRNI